LPIAMESAARTLRRCSDTDWAGAARTTGVSDSTTIAVAHARIIVVSLLATILELTCRTK
jgi:hypothetical protein